MSDPTVAKKTYFGVAGALMGLLVLTVAVSYVPLGAFGVVAALTIAFAKALLIVLYFMHIRYSSRMTMVLAGAGLLWVVLLFLLTFGDYVTRSW